MKQPRKPFMPVTPDVDDDALESLARDKGVGLLVKPVANRAGEEEALSMPSPSGSGMAELASASSPAHSSQATPRSRMSFSFTWMLTIRQTTWPISNIRVDTGLT